MDPSARESGRWMEGRKNILNSPPSTSVRAPVTEPSPQQSNSAYRTLRFMRITREFLQFNPRTIIIMTEMDHRCPCFGKSDKHRVGHPRGAKSGKRAYWQLRRTWSPMSPNSTRSRIQFPNTTPQQWPWPEITLCPSR